MYQEPWKIKNMSKKWRQNGSFCRWLIKKQYARYDDDGKFVSSVSEGVALYMWEAYRAGVMDTKKEKRSSNA